METLFEALPRRRHMEREVNGRYLFAEAEVSGLLQLIVRRSLCLYNEEMTTLDPNS